jgi:hypothetical protein
VAVDGLQHDATAGDKEQSKLTAAHQHVAAAGFEQKSRLPTLVVLLLTTATYNEWLAWRMGCDRAKHPPRILSVTRSCINLLQVHV